MPFDLGVGLFLGVWLGHVTTLPPPLALGLGIVACLLPDVDALWGVFRVGYNKLLTEHDHREGLHYPLIYLLIVALTFFIDPAIGTVFIVGSLIHFIHDSIGIGWGIQWLYPFKKNSYCFLYRVPLKAEAGLPKKLLYSWDPAEKKEVMARYADPHYVRNIYLRLTPWSVMEYLAFVGGVIAALTR